jgi:SAM-dependent methyltransferase
VNYRIRHDCRLCGSDNLRRVLDLADTPLANEFVAEPGGAQDKFPLYLVQCQRCDHVQLPVVVDPERLFRNYVYVSGTSPSFVAHFERYATEMCERHSITTGDLVVEIGSNDGTLLRFFKARSCRVIGIDPAVDIASRATAGGIDTWPTFFDRNVAASIVESHGKVRLVVANNVFAHADDLLGIASGVRDLLHPDGRFVFEVQYLRDLVDKSLFDMVYHEHLSYHHLSPLMNIFGSLGMCVVDAECVDTHGGSLRVTVAPGAARPSMRAVELWSAEQAISWHASFARLSLGIADTEWRLRRYLEENVCIGEIVVGYGAPAKATTLMHQFGLSRGHVDYVVDDSPLKQGLFTPGEHIPVVSSEHMRANPPEHLIVFAWNFAESIIRKLDWFRGSIVVPLPEFKVVQQ